MNFDLNLSNYEDEEIKLFHGNLEKLQYKTVALFIKKYYDKNDIKIYNLDKRAKYNKSILENLKNYPGQHNSKVFKYRPYFKAVKNSSDINTQNILTFILYNPSYANQNFLDDTIQNCAKLSQKENFDGFEILNLFNIRNPKIDKINVCTKDVNYDYDFPEGIPTFKKVFLAFGCREYGQEEMQILNNNLNKLLKYQKEETKYFVISREGEKERTKHFGNLAWIKQGGFDKYLNTYKMNNFEISKFNNIEILRNGFINTK